MSREDRKKKRKGRHAEGASELPRTPEVAGRQVYPIPPDAGAEDLYVPQPPADPGGAGAVPGQPLQAGPTGVTETPGQPAAAPGPVPLAPPEPTAPPPSFMGDVPSNAPWHERAVIPEHPPTVLPGAGTPPGDYPAPAPEVEDLLEEQPGQTIEPEAPPPPEPALPPETGMPQEPPYVPFGAGRYIPPGAPPGQGYFYPPPWYPPRFVPGPYYGMPHPGITGQIPIPPGAHVTGTGPSSPSGQVTPPAGGVPETGPFGAMPMPPGYPPMSYMPDGPAPPVFLDSLEEPEFGSLAAPESHWRGDLKWVFGIITALFIFLALLSAGLYRSTGPGAAKRTLLPVIENATQVKKFIRDNYQDLRSRARRSTGSKIYIPDIGISVSIEGDVIRSLSPEDLADRVILEAERQIYDQGYKQALPMSEARGAGEERGKATVVTLLSKMNAKQHASLVWPIVIFSVLALAFGILLAVCCRGWGKAIGVGMAVIAGALPGSLALRIAGQFVFKPHVSGTFRPVSNAAMRTVSSMSVSFFDIALAFGGLALVIGVIGAVIARKSRERVPPFLDLKRPERVVAGGPALEPGMEGGGIPDETESFML